MMSWLSLENHYERTDGGINFYYNAGKHVINDGYAAGGKPQPYLFNSTDYQGGFNIFQAVRPWEGGTLTAGVDLKLYGGNAYRNPTTEIYADHRKLHEEAFYLFDQQTVGKFMFNAGIRLDNHSVYGLQWIPQAGLSFMPAWHTTLKLSASKGFRAPNMRELYMFMSANPNLNPEEAWSYDFTLGNHFLGGALNTEISLFYTKGSNIIEVVREGGKPQNRNVGAFANKGVEVAADWRLSPQFQLNTNYSFLHMDTVYTGAPKHKFWFGGNWSNGKFLANAGIMVIDGLYLTTGDNARTAHYADLKAKAGYQVTPWMQLFVRGENLLGKAYETMDGFPGPGATVLGGISLSL
jgi:iron complex outermembrane receptor protein